MKIEYKTISLRTAKGIKTAERLKANGWRVISTGWDTIQMERPKPVKTQS